MIAGRQERELLDSKTTLEANPGAPVEVFSYPYGDDAGTAAMLRATLPRTGYRAACLYGGGTMSLPAVDRYRLERIAMGPPTDLRVELEEVSPA